MVAPGYKADLNVIDFDALSLALPELAFDLPGGARRLVQKADGYESTFVAGEETMHDGEDTGARPGRLVRGHAGGHARMSTDDRAAPATSSSSPPARPAHAGEDPGVPLHLARVRHA